MGLTINLAELDEWLLDNDNLTQEEREVVIEVLTTYDEFQKEISK